VLLMRTVMVALAGLLFAAAPARAEIVVLISGRTLSVKAHRPEGDQTVLELRAGGEIVCDSTLIARIEPDEVPWPQPVTAAEVTVAGSAPLEVVSTPFDQLIDPLSAQHGVDAALVRAVIATESAFEPRARSPRGAMGLMQLMPDTARQYAVANPYDPSSNLQAGIRHLKFLLGRYDIRVALAAYNAGEATVRRHGGVPPYRETREYVDRVLRRLQRYRREVAPATRSTDPARPELGSPAS
jgi:hypothetical protein